MTLAVTSLRAEAVTAARRLSAAITAGAVVGFAVGGVGGRVAMFVLRLTSDPSLRGLPTDDGFTIGVVSGESIFLLLLGTIVGVWSGALYVAFRPWFPRAARPWVFGALAGAVGGAVVLRPDGIDFTALEPLWFAVVLFVAIPAAYGVGIPLLADRLLEPGSRFAGSMWIAGLVVSGPLLLIVPPAAAIVAVAAVALAIGRERLVNAWSSPPVMWLGRAAIAAATAAGAVRLASDVAAIL